MSQVRRERGVEQGHGEEGFYRVEDAGTSLLSWLGCDAGLYASPLPFQLVKTRLRDGSRPLREGFLIDVQWMYDFAYYICPRLQERRDLLNGERGRKAEREQLQQQLRREQRSASEAQTACANAVKESERWKGLHDELYREFEQGLQQNALAAQAWEEVNGKNERLSGANARLRQDLAEAQRSSVKAQQDANEARIAASSTQQKLEETETAYEEAKKHFIRAPDLVLSLQSLTNEVKTLQETVQTSGERTTEAVARRPPDGRNEKTLQQMKRVLHDIGRYPRRRRREKAADAADDGGSVIKRGRICYVCRCKGHLAKNCPQVRTVGTTSAEPTMSDAEQRPAESSAEASSSGWTIFSALRRFTSGID